ncbi:MAG: bifunctional diaminohydroxyphosphoribosylaminopyrimidine deaminase/5-amino-6-(5-phosphoribosylamino)uracil reductase RibD [bacterium]|nr:bifunctional diaminohydroxyphosphoribosylaminopyrimidine deaminase/5-amino-6-(5-phosphoribosylamino)uracil reductase RibD [bacterium]
MMTDIDYMRRALELAARGRGRVHPNPMVGAVAVRDGRVVGEGFHPGPGQPHAEVFALKEVAAGTPGVTVYVNLEPCSFVGRTPPCADLLVEKGVTRVVCAMSDPDERVSEKGFARLKGAGIDVIVGVLEAEARALNAAYVKHRTTGLPYVTLKLAQTLDGRIATASGDSKWISSEASRVRAHRLRADADAILIGSGTLKADDPELSVRHVEGESPAKIVLDSRLEISTGAKVFEGAPLWLATSEGVSNRRLQEVEAAGAGVWVIGGGGRPGLLDVLRLAADKGYLHVLIEGGGQVAASALRGNLVDRVAVFVAPKILGEGISSVGDLGIDRISDAVELDLVEVEQIGNDLFYAADVVGATEQQG